MTDPGSTPVTGGAVIERTALVTGETLAPVTVGAEGMEQPVDAHRLAGRKRFVAGDAVLRSGAVGKIVMTCRADKARMVVMQEIRMIDG